MLMILLTIGLTLFISHGITCSAYDTDKVSGVFLFLSVVILVCTLCLFIGSRYL